MDISISSSEKQLSAGWAEARTLDRVRPWFDAEDAGLDRGQVETRRPALGPGRQPQVEEPAADLAGNQLPARPVPERVLGAIDLDVDGAGFGDQAQRDGAPVPAEESVPVGNGHLESVPGAAGMPLAVVPGRCGERLVSHCLSM